MTLQHMTIITLALGLMVTLGSVFITGIVAATSITGLGSSASR
jgi:hypothetical protein